MVHASSPYSFTSPTTISAFTHSVSIPIRHPEFNPALHFVIVFPVVAQYTIDTLGKYGEPVELLTQTLGLMDTFLWFWISTHIGEHAQLGVTDSKIRAIWRGTRLVGKTLLLRRKVLGPDHPNTIRTMTGVGMGVQRPPTFRWVYAAFPAGVALVGQNSRAGASSHAGDYVRSSMFVREVGTLAWSSHASRRKN